MIYSWPRRAWAAAATLTLAIAGPAHLATAAVQTLVGVDEVTFAWQPASGNPSAYYVRRSLNGSPMQSYAVAAANSITIPVAPGEAMAISVRAGAYDGNGVFVMGPASPVSDTVSVVSAPQFAKSGRWLLRCATCPSFESRSLGNASVVVDTALALPKPWVVLGRVTLDGAEMIVWHNPQTGALQLWDSATLRPTSISTTSPGVAVRGVGAADLDGNGTEEFLIQRTDTLAVSVWGRTGSGFRQVAQLSGPAGARLAAARDFDRDGRVDLLWHRPTTGLLDLARFSSIPLLGTGGTIASLVAPLLTRVTSGLSSNAAVASNADYDGDGAIDVLLRYSTGALAILYLDQDGALEDFVWLPAAPDDVNRVVVSSRRMNDRPGAEIALQHLPTGEISILDPLVVNRPERIAVLTAGSKWEALAMGL